MFNTSTHSLKILSGLFWYIGGVMLILKGGTLLFEANRLKPDPICVWLSIFEESIPLKQGLKHDRLESLSHKACPTLL